MVMLASKDQHVRGLCAAPSHFWWRGKAGVLALKIGRADPTGLRAATSYVNGEALGDRLRHQLTERWQAKRR
jgi:hypothetical protein